MKKMQRKKRFKRKYEIMYSQTTITRRIHNGILNPTGGGREGGIKQIKWKKKKHELI